MFKSIYEGGEVLLATDSLVPFITQNELWPDADGVKTEIEVVYTADGKYVGDVAHASHLITRGITAELQPANGVSGTCAVGFNPLEQKWYGWSHRAMFGFGIGSAVKKGDCGYQPTDIEDFNRNLMEFWDVDTGEWRSCDAVGIACTTQLVSITSNYLEDQHAMHYSTGYTNVTSGDGPEAIDIPPTTTATTEPLLGTLLITRTVFKGDRASYESRYFKPYPKVWGRGEWVATTLGDAKQMAIDFAHGVDG